MKKVIKMLIVVGICLIAMLIFNNSKVNASQYIWPIGGENANETYKDYDFYGSRNAAPYKDGKSGREYIVDNSKWPNEQAYYAKCESHYGMDITGINGSSYKVVSVVNGKVIATSANRVYNPSINYKERNKRRTQAGLKDGGGYGNYIIIKETSTGRCFLYAHLKGGSIQVSKGSEVKVGQEIATMGSSGDSGHMHLHFEIRKSKAVTLRENRYGKHYLVTTNSNTNLDPEEYIGSKPNVHMPYNDDKKVKLSQTDAKYYLKYLYRNVLKREASDSEVESWINVYNQTESISHITSGIFLSIEAEVKNGKLSNLDFAQKLYELVLYRGNNYTEEELIEDVNKLDRGIWNRRDYIAMLCNCDEFVDKKISLIIKYEKNRENGFIVPEEQLKMLGDLNGDGKINSTDASICLSLCSKLGTGDDSDIRYIIKYADVDNDGRVSAIDACLILQYSANIGAGNFTMEEKSLAQFVGRDDINN